jgi:hypothetical protein
MSRSPVDLSSRRGSSSNRIEGNDKRDDDHTARQGPREREVSSAAVQLEEAAQGEAAARRGATGRLVSTFGYYAESAAINPARRYREELIVRLLRREGSPRSVLDIGSGIGDLAGAVRVAMSPTVPRVQARAPTRRRERRLCVGYLGSLVEEAIGDGSRLGLSVPTHDGPAPWRRRRGETSASASR